MLPSIPNASRRGVLFLKKVRPDPSLAPEALMRLGNHPWPGNVRELKNVIERMAALATTPVLGVTDATMGPVMPGQTAQSKAGGGEVEGVEARAIKSALLATRGNKSVASRLLGIARSTLRRKMTEYGIRDVEEEKS